MGVRAVELKKKYLAAGLSLLAALLLITVLIFLANSRKAFDIKALLESPGTDNARQLQEYLGSLKESEKEAVLSEIRNWMEQSLEDYTLEELTKAQMEERLLFVQLSGCSDHEELLDWNRRKEEADHYLKGKSLYEEALAWFEAGQYSLARESAGMIQQNAGGYYQKAQDLMTQCGEKEEEEKLLQEEETKQEYLQELARLYRRYARMNTENVWEANDLTERYEEVINALKGLSQGAQLAAEAQKQYPLEEWKVECKKLILGNLADGVWPEQTGFMLRETPGVPFVIIKTPDQTAVYIWSKTTAGWSELEYGGYSCLGMNAEEISFLYYQKFPGEECYVWLTLEKSGWEIRDTLQKREEEYRVLWLFPATRTVYLQNGERISRSAYENRILYYQEKCADQELEQATGRSLSEALGDLKL